MTNVFVIRFYSTRENWNSCVCADEESVQHVLDGYGITKFVYGSVIDKWREFENPNDKSQTATVVEKQLFKLSES